MDDLFDLDLYFDPQSVQKRGSAEQSTAALIASSMNSEYTDDWLNRQTQAPNHMVQAPSHMGHATNHMAHAPSHMAHAPNQMVQAPNQMVQAPNHMFQAPSHMVQAPNQMVQGPNQMVQAPALTRLDPAAYAPIPSSVANDPSSTCMPNVNNVGSFGLHGELSLPPLSAPTDNVNYIPQLSDLMNYSDLEPIGGEVDQGKNNSTAYASNGAATYGDGGVLGSAVCHDLQRLDGRPQNAFMGPPLSTKKDYTEETPYYTDLDIFKPIEEVHGNSDGGFLSPSVEINNQHPPNYQSASGDGTGSQKKVKTPRKTPSKKRKGLNSEDQPGSQNENSSPSNTNDYTGDGRFSCSNSDGVAFPQIPSKPESTTSNQGKVKSPRKTPSKKKKAVVNYSASIDGSSLKMKLKCEKSIGTDSAEWSVSGNKETAKNPPTSQPSKPESLDHIGPASPESSSNVAENKTELVPTSERSTSKSERKSNASDVDKSPNLSSAKSKTLPILPLSKHPSVKIPNYLTGFPMRCPEYPIVYCCNHCARIFTSIRGGQLHECVKKRPGRKAGIKLQ